MGKSLASVPSAHLVSSDLCPVPGSPPGWVPRLPDLHSLQGLVLLGGWLLVPERWRPWALSVSDLVLVDLCLIPHLTDISD